MKSALKYTKSTLKHDVGSFRPSVIRRRMIQSCSAFLITSSFASAQAPSSLFPDITQCKLEYPLSSSGEDYRGVAYNDRRSPEIRNAIVENLNNYVAPVPFRNYFFADGNEMVFRAHCAGALTSANAYPRCELRQQINGEDTFWDYSDEHELNVTFRITNLPNEKQEVCVVQLKGTNTPSRTSGSSEVLRVEYRQDGVDGWHLEVNESAGPKNVLDYSLGQTVNIRVYVNDDRVTLVMRNLSNGDTYNTSYASEYSDGYFKAGAYTQSSIWSEKSGVDDEDPDAFSEVRFSQFTLGSVDNIINTPVAPPETTTCTATTPANRVISNIGETSVTVNWTFDANMDHYNLRYREVGNSTWSYQTSLRENEGDFNVSGSTASYSLSGLSADTEYEWQMRAKCPDGDASPYTSGSNFTTTGGSSSNIVYLVKRNSTGYAIDGNTRPSDGRNVHLYSYDRDNANQQWEEIDRGNGYFTYQKAGTNFSLDGGNGGADRQNVYLWTTGSTNYNQHWQKVSVGGGAYKLIKRNASGFTIDGGSGGANRQNVKLYDSSNSSENLQWFVR